MANLELAVQNCQAQLIAVDKGATKNTAVSATKDSINNNNISNNMEDSRRDEWSADAINNLLDVYEAKWNHRNRGNLKGGDWEDVAMRVSARGGGGKSAKSPFQCKNKVASMKQKYRSETLLQGINGSSSSRWPFFGRMDVMLRVRSPNPQPIQVAVADLRLQGGVHSGDSEQEILRLGSCGGTGGGGGTVGGGGRNVGVLLSNGEEQHRIRIGGGGGGGDGGGGGGSGGGLPSSEEGQHKMTIGGGGSILFNEEEQHKLRFGGGGLGGTPCNGEEQQHRPESHSKNSDDNNNNNEHHHDNNSEANDNGDDNNQNDDASNTLPYRKPLGESDDTSTPRSKAAHLQAPAGGIIKSTIKHKKYLSKEVAASIRSFADSILKLERAKMEMFKDSERLRAQLEARRVDMELKRTEIIMNTQLEIAKLLSGTTKKKTLKKKSGGATGTSTTSASTAIAAIATQHEASAGPSAAAGISSSPSRNGVSVSMAAALNCVPCQNLADYMPPNGTHHYNVNVVPQSSMPMPPPTVSAMQGTPHPRPHHFLPTTIPISVVQPIPALQFMVSPASQPKPD